TRARRGLRPAAMPRALGIPPRHPWSGSLFEGSMATLPIMADVPSMPAHLERRLTRDMGRALNGFHLLEDGDRLLVAMSGGKDSYALCVLLRDLQRRAPIRFEITAVHVDQGHPGYDGAPLDGWLKDQGIPYRVLHEDTYTIVTEKIPE